MRAVTWSNALNQCGFRLSLKVAPYLHSTKGAGTPFAMDANATHYSPTISQLAMQARGKTRKRKPGNTTQQLHCGLADAIYWL